MLIRGVIALIQIAFRALDKNAYRAYQILHLIHRLDYVDFMIRIVYNWPFSDATHVHKVIILTLSNVYLFHFFAMRLAATIHVLNAKLDGHYSMANVLFW